MKVISQERAKRGCESERERESEKKENNENLDGSEEVPRHIQQSEIWTHLHIGKVANEIVTHIQTLPPKRRIREFGKTNTPKGEREKQRETERDRERERNLECQKVFEG
jgi:hypothetical protein